VSPTKITSNYFSFLRQERSDRIGGTWSLQQAPSSDTAAAIAEDADDGVDDDDYDYIDEDSDNEEGSLEDKPEAEAECSDHNISEGRDSNLCEEEPAAPTAGEEEHSSAERKIAAKFRTEKARLVGRLRGLEARQAAEERQAEVVFESAKQDLEREYGERLEVLEEAHVANMEAVEKKFALEKRHLEVCLQYLRKNISVEDKQNQLRGYVVLLMATSISVTRRYKEYQKRKTCME
jgi:hypothetical protein